MDPKNDEVPGQVGVRAKPDSATPDALPDSTDSAGGSEAADSTEGQSVEEQIAEIEKAAEERKAQILKAAADKKAAAEKAAAEKAESDKVAEDKAAAEKVEAGDKVPSAKPDADKPEPDKAESEKTDTDKPADGAKTGTTVAAAAAGAATAAGATVVAAGKSDDKPAEDAKSDETVTADASADTKAADTKPEETKAEDKTGADAAKADDSATPDSASGGGGEPPSTSTPGTGSGGGFSLPKSVKAKVIAGVAVVLVIALAVGGFLYYRANTVPDGVALRVNGTDVTVAELNDDIQTQKALLGFEVPKDGPKLDQFRKDFAKSIAFTMVIEKAAADRNIVVADRQASDVLAKIISQNYGDGPEGHDKSVQAMAANGTSEPKVLAEIKRQMTVTQLVQQVAAGVQASDADVKQYFDSHKDQLATPERRDIHNIVVKDKAAADQIVAQLNTGANFEQLAQQQSMDTSTKDKGGDLGPQPAQQLEPEFAKAAFSAPLNGVFGPVQGEHGYNVGKIAEILPSTPANFDQIKDAIRQQVIAERGSEKWRQFLEDSIKSAKVVYADEYRPADPDSLAPPPGADGQPAPAPAGQPEPPK
ncbi:peptidyl-prolyl cis-trans isomerase [Pseudonocardia spinosispora]|uniref:peptidyl-prolyl cis-trans isomerase n=1 Tax=Pseudonocardia spinosispora TaxID=103441 RepID=UPI0003FCB229|nr:peptidyl-prolyl cis-trans isomerase [Pseudonocardia spinosispora]